MVDKRVFQWGVDWPGWCRSGKTELEAIDRLVAAGRALQRRHRPGRLRTADRQRPRPVRRGQHPGWPGDPVRGPGAFGPVGRAPDDAEGADRLARLVEATWLVFDEIAAGAPAELRKGPRGGGRDRDKMVEHVLLAEHAYARNMGLKLPTPDPADPASIGVVRQAIAAVLREPSDGSPIEGRKWNCRYAARRVAWHALDHAWEMEDRSDPA